MSRKQSDKSYYERNKETIKAKARLRYQQKKKLLEQCKEKNPELFKKENIKVKDIKAKEPEKKEMERNEIKDESPLYKLPKSTESNKEKLKRFKAELKDYEKQLTELDKDTKHGNHDVRYKINQNIAILKMLISDLKK